MGIMQQAIKTYDTMAKTQLGMYNEGEKEPLCPISHIITSAQIEITIDTDGNFIAALQLDKNEPKIIIPASEASAGRSGTSANEKPHPLCDKLKYIIAENNYYIPKLELWANSEYSHPKIKAVLAYVKNGSIISDLENAGIVPDKEALVRWRISDVFSDNPEECWKDTTLFDEYIEYYRSNLKNTGMCMLSGECIPTAEQHPKGIVPLFGNAKLISANDNSGFTYRGRFTDDTQAASVGYVATQKAHSALRWVAVNQGNYIGGRCFVCWSPSGERVPKVHNPLSGRTAKPIIKPSDYRAELRKTLLGKKENLNLNANAVIASFDAATTGRLSVTYYSELPISDFLDRLHDWDESCCWKNGVFGIQSPHLRDIVDCAFGTQRKEKNQIVLSTDDKIMAQQMQRLIACRIDGARMPEDIMQALVNKATVPSAYEPVIWRKVVYTACAVIQKYYEHLYEEELCMDWALDKKDRSFQFGRLLAAMERLEADYYRESGKEERQTNAIKALSVFKQTPMVTAERVNSALEQAYVNRVNKYNRDRYEKLKGEIFAILADFPENEINKPLSPLYLIGYELQRNEFFKTKPENTETEIEEE